MEDDKMKRVLIGLAIIAMFIISGCGEGFQTTGEAYAKGGTTCNKDGNVKCGKDGDLYKCQEQSGKNKWTWYEACERPCVKDADVCPSECVAEEFKCEGDDLWDCKESGKFAYTQTCEFGCDATEGCLDPACYKDETTCEGDDLMVCQNDRRGFEKQKECDKGCSAGECNFCDVDGAVKCEGGKEYTCSESTNEWGMTLNCQFGGCDSETNRCKTAFCEEGETGCDGDKLLTCNAGQTAFNSEKCNKGCGEKTTEVYACHTCESGTFTKLKEGNTVAVLCTNGFDEQEISATSARNLVVSTASGPDIPE